MTANSYLTNLANKLIIRDTEKDKIKTSISTLETRLTRYFNSKGKNIEAKFMFGSYTRGTILPRKVDSGSDIDYMVVFENPNNNAPSTLLNWLKEFVENSYQTSEIYQSHPTIVLELQHIKFELVPAYDENSFLRKLYPSLNTAEEYKIPAPAKDYLEWMSTNPCKLNKEVSNKNVANDSLIKPAIRLLKYWNILNGKIYSSYELEEIAISQYYYSSTETLSLTKVLNVMVQALHTYTLTSTKSAKVKKLKSDMLLICENENLTLAEIYAKTLFVDI